MAAESLHIDDCLYDIIAWLAENKYVDASPFIYF